jgi:hypothetical protein
MKFMGCKICNSTGWVCENHRNIPWGEEEGECECGAGKNCICNPDGHIEMTAVYASVKPEEVKTWVN